MSQDFESIGLTSNLSYLRFSTFIGIFIGLLTFVILFRKSKELDAKEALVKLINLFFINTSVLIFSIYIFRFFNFSRLYLIINLILYPIIFFVILSLLFTYNKFNFKVLYYLYSNSNSCLCSWLFNK